MYQLGSGNVRNAPQAAFDRVINEIGLIANDPKAELAIEGTRILDVVLAVMALILLSPVMLLIAVTIKLQDGGPILFGHTRIGRGGRRFKCFKFRSMVVDAEARLHDLLDRDPGARQEWAADQKLRVDPRITAFGSRLRKSSIDEVPQLFRPIVQAEVVRYGRAYRYYCAVRPDITGLWQVSGRNDVSYRQRVALDALYARSRSLGLNLSIILRTVPAVLQRKGSY